MLMHPKCTHAHTLAYIYICYFKDHTIIQNRNTRSDIMFLHGLITVTHISKQYDSFTTPLDY